MTASTFIIGYLIGLILIIMMRRFFKERLYIWRLWAAVKLTLIFFRELITVKHFCATLSHYSPKLNIQPMIFALPTDLEA